MAFGIDGIEELNQNIQILNEGKPHQPIYKVRTFEVGSKFALGDTGNNGTKYVEADKGTNLFFNIYWDEKKEKRNYETVPLNEVIAHQKAVAALPKNERTEAPTNPALGKYLFTLSPDDLVYVPTEEELENSTHPDFKILSKEKISRIYKMVSSTGTQCFFIKANVSNVIQNKIEYSALNKMEKDIENNMIKSICWKLSIDRLGNINRIG